jgi:NADH-quinone oxidoreductase subunit C
VDPVTENANPLLESVARAFPDEVLLRETSCGMEILTVQPRRLTEIFDLLRDKEQVDFLADVTAVDCLKLDRPWDFEVVYQLCSTPRGFLRARLKAAVHGRSKPSLPTATGHWESAGWPEREVMEMFGIAFEGHPDPRKLLLPENFESFPLRKDYPVKGLGEREAFPVLDRAFQPARKES